MPLFLPPKQQPQPKPVWKLLDEIEENIQLINEMGFTVGVWKNDNWNGLHFVEIRRVYPEPRKPR